MNYVPPLSHADGGQPAKPRKRPNAIARISSFLFSAATAFAVATIGYYCFAGIPNMLMPDSSLGGILIRAGTIALVVIAWLRYFKYRDRVGAAYLLAAIVFLSAYTLRMIDNAIFQGIQLPPDNTRAFLFFGISTVIPAFLIAGMAWRIDDRAFRVVMTGLCAVFLLSLLGNRDELLVTAESRMMLDKINPISLAHAALAFVFYYFLIYSKSKILLIEAIFLVPLLLFVIVLAQSRGAVISGTAAILFYVLLLKGTRRIWALLGLVFGSVMLATVVAPEQFRIVVDGLERIVSGTDMSTNIREQAYTGGWEQFLQDPVFGRFILELSTNYYSHNIYLESLMAVGLVGTAFFAMHLAIALRAAIGIVRSSTQEIAPKFVSLLFFKQLVSDAASGTVYNATVFWIASFLLIALWYGRPDSRRPPIHLQRRLGGRDQRRRLRSTAPIGVGR